MSGEKKESKGQGCYLVSAFWALVVVIIWEIFWPNVIPFEFGQFLPLKVSLGELIANTWPILAWGGGLTFVASLLTRNHPKINQKAEKIFTIGVIRSIFAGVTEEISFRWWIFFAQIILYQILNTIFFGFLGFGIFEWIFLHLTGPLADFSTGHLLQPILFGSLWFVGAAIISSNGKFRDGHLYLGWFGYVNSWFLGMIMFYVMFTYGLVGAIIMHVLYDLVIYLALYLDSVIERARGN